MTKAMVMMPVDAAEYDTDAAMISQPSDCRGLNGSVNDEGNGDDASRSSGIE